MYDVSFAVFVVVNSCLCKPEPSASFCRGAKQRFQLHSCISLVPLKTNFEQQKELEVEETEVGIVWLQTCRKIKKEREKENSSSGWEFTVPNLPLDPLVYFCRVGAGGRANSTAVTAR